MSPSQPILNPADLEPTASDPIVGQYAQDLAGALQKAASHGLAVQLPPPGAQAVPPAKSGPYQTQAPAQPTPDTNFLYGTAKPGPYQTRLPFIDEMQFQQWVRSNQIPWVDSPTADYDMRGFWQAAQKGDPRASTAINPADKQIHYPDVWKTPYHQTFSNESQYATPRAPRWVGNDQTGWMLVDRLGSIIHDERTQK